MKSAFRRRRFVPNSRKRELFSFTLMNLLIFDLDGTLIDSKLDLAHAVNATRATMGMEPLDHELIYSYVGSGAPVLIRRAIGPDASEEQIETALQFFLAYYQEHKLDYTVLYPGVRETLQALQAAGRQMAVLTNKPVRISKAILDGLGIGSFFVRVYGGNSFEQKKPNPIGVATLLDETQTGASQALMVGDSAVDVETARNAGIASCGVTYGFQPETLAVAEPDYLINRMEELLDVLARPLAGPGKVII
jgi:phosphoglycolate phosphatase